MTPLFQTLPLGAVRPGGWILSQMQSDLLYGFAGRLDTLTAHASHDLFKDRIAASQSQLAWWDSETRGNWLWGYVMMAYLAGEPEHMARAAALIADLLQTQDADGYIGIYSPEWRYNHPPGENGELWSQGRALLCLLAYHELTGDPNARTAAERAVQLTMRHYGPHGTYFQGKGPDETLAIGLGHGLCYVDVAEWLYRLTGDTAYRDFGLWLYDDFNRMPVPFDNDDFALPNLLRRDKPFSGHAVHTVEHLRALALYAAHRESTDHVSALENALFKLSRYALPSGAVIGDEGIHGLPLPDSGYEYCTLTEMLFSLTSMAEKFGLHYGDWVERIAFNAAQGARMANGSGISYLTADTRLTATQHRPDSYSHLHGTAGRFKISPTHEDIACCCNPNAVRLMPHYVARMWLRATDGLAAMAYGPCTLTTEIDGVRVQIVAETDYPFELGIVLTVTVDRPVAFTLYLRKPSWAAPMMVNAAGGRVQDFEEFVGVRKTWESGDSVRIGFGAAVRVEPYPNGEYSVHWGALQFAQPIAHRATPIKDYPVPDFHDYTLTPANLRGSYQVPVLEEGQANYGMALEHARAAANWDFPAVRLHHIAGSLVPLGCTALRRAAFPLILSE